MIACAFCGRDNDPSSKFCIDCGKPVVASGARVIPVPGAVPPGIESRFSVPQTRVSQTPGNTPPGGTPKAKAPCRHCGTLIDPALPFCPKCGGRVNEAQSPQSPSTAVCSSCGKAVTVGVDVFCARCGARAGLSDTPPAPASATAAFSARQPGIGPKIAVLDAAGQITRTFTLDTGEVSVGRLDGELTFPADVFMSPVHAQLSFREGQLFVRDLGSRNSTWLFTDAPYKLQDGDTVLIGSQLLRFRRLGYPGPHPPEADATRRLGSATPNADIAVLQQLRADGSARDSCHLSPGRAVVIGRAEGDWIFPYDQTMSGKHAEVRGEDLEFIVIDLGSRNGIAVAVRGEKPVRAGQRILLGDQTLRVESLA